jgi:hypothetical protein
MNKDGIMKQLFIVAAAFLLALPAFAPALAQGAPSLPGSFTIPSASAPAPQTQGANAASSAPEGAAPQKEVIFNKLFDSLPRGIQDEIMNEATEVEQSCSKNNIYSYFHDCECLGTKFIEQRLNHPDEAKENLTHNIRLECVNPPGVAGYSYDYCFRQFAYLMPSSYGDKQKDQTCKCYARLMAKRYAESPDPSYSYISNMQMRTIDDCLNQ